MKILCLTDFVVQDGHRWLWDFVSENQDQIDFLHVRTADRFPKWGKLITSYPRYFQLAWRAYKHARSGDYDLIVAWESDTGFPLAVLRRLSSYKSPPLVILTFSMRGPVAHIKSLREFGVRGADYFTVPTRYEQEYYARELRISSQRIFHCPIGVYDVFGRAVPPEGDGFVFSGGRSGRDYRTFLEAIGSLDHIPATVNARPFNLKGLEIPPNVQTNNILPFNEFRDLNSASSFVVVPLVKANAALGLTSILYAMSAGRPVIATDLPGAEEYVVEGKTGLLVPLEDVEAMQRAINYLWENPDLCWEMGQQARKLFENHYTFNKFSDRVVNLLNQLVMT